MDNFKTSVGIWIPLVLTETALAVVTYRLLSQGHTSMSAAMIGICMAFFLFILAIRNATVISIHHGGETIYMLVMTLGLATMFVVGWKFMPLILLIMPSVYTLLISYFMEKVLIQYTPEEEQNASDEDEAASEDMLYTEEHKEKPWYLEGGDKDE